MFYAIMEYKIDIEVDSFYDLMIRWSNSFNNSGTHISSMMVVVIVWYSASFEDAATVCCFQRTKRYK